MKLRDSKITVCLLVLISMCLVTAICYGQDKLEDKKLTFNLQYMFPSGDFNNGVGLGVYGLGIFDGGVGFYGNVIGSFKSSLDNDYRDTIPIGSSGNPVVERYKDYFGINVGFTKQVAKPIHLYAGLGYVGTSGYAKEYDTRNNYYYYVNDTENSEYGLNGNFGALFLVKHLTLEVGYNTYIHSANIGVGFNF